MALLCCGAGSARCAELVTVGDGCVCVCACGERGVRRRGEEVRLMQTTRGARREDESTRDGREPKARRRDHPRHATLPPLCRLWSRLPLPDFASVVSRLECFRCVEQWRGKGGVALLADRGCVRAWVGCRCSSSRLRSLVASPLLDPPARVFTANQPPPPLPPPSPLPLPHTPPPTSLAAPLVSPL